MDRVFFTRGASPGTGPGKSAAGIERGGCEAPTIPDKAIDIPVGGTRREDLDTTIHEALHACFWEIDEEAITEAANDISTFVWRLGWRKRRDKNTIQMPTKEVEQ